MDSTAFRFASLRVAWQALPALRRGIDVQLHGATVERALQTIARVADLELVYDSERIAIAKRVTIDAERVPAHVAFSAVMRGTGLDLKAPPSGHLVLVHTPGVDHKVSGACMP